MFRVLLLLISLIFITNFVKARAFTWWPYHPSHHYRQLSPACEKFGKSKIVRWDLDTTEELVVLINSCRGNGDASCIKMITSAIASQDFDSLVEFAPLALSCRGSDSSCIQWMKGKLSWYNFDDPEEVMAVARACFATDMRCVEEICNNDRWACNDDNEYFQIVQTCSSPKKKK